MLAHLIPITNSAGPQTAPYTADAACLQGVVVGFKFISIAGFRRPAATVLTATEPIDTIVVFFADSRADAGTVSAQLPANTGCHLIAPTVVAAAAHANTITAAILIFNAFFGFDAIEEFGVADLNAGATTRVGSDGLPSGVFWACIAWPSIGRRPGIAGCRPAWASTQGKAKKGER